MKCQFNLYRFNFITIACAFWQNSMFLLFLNVKFRFKRLFYVRVQISLCVQNYTSQKKESFNNCHYPDLIEFTYKVIKLFLHFLKVHVYLSYQKQILIFNLVELETLILKYNYIHVLYKRKILP